MIPTAMRWLAVAALTLWAVTAAATAAAERLTGVHP